MRRAKFTVIAGAIGALAAVLSLSGPVEAGTCQPVDAKGKGKDIATTRAQADLAVKAAVLVGKVTQTSTNCTPGPTKVVCKISAVVCPR